MLFSVTLKYDENTPLLQLPYLNFHYTEKNKVSFSRVDCRICGLTAVNEDHLYGKKHTKQAVEALRGLKRDRELFKKFYAETYISIKYEPWREKMRKELEIFDESGLWYAIYLCRLGIPEDVIRNTFSSLLFRDAMALLELSIIKCFMKQTKKRKFVAAENETTNDDSEFTIFETIRTTRAHQILQLVKPFLYLYSKPNYKYSRWRF